MCVCVIYGVHICYIYNLNMTFKIFEIDIQNINASLAGKKSPRQQFVRVPSNKSLHVCLSLCVCVCAFLCVWECLHRCVVCLCFYVCMGGARLFVPAWAKTYVSGNVCIGVMCVCISMCVAMFA